MPDAHDHSNEKIQEALKLLEEAACEKRDALKTLISERYTHLKDAMSDSESNVKESFNRMSHRTRRASTALPRSRRRPASVKWPARSTRTSTKPHSPGLTSAVPRWHRSCSGTSSGASKATASGAHEETAEKAPGAGSKTADP